MFYVLLFGAFVMALFFGLGFVFETLIYVAAILGLVWVIFLFLREISK